MMVRLSRRVRFTVQPIKVGGGGIGAYFELDAECEGNPDPETGYLINIKHIDQAVRARAIPIIEKAVRVDPARGPASHMPGIIDALRADLPGLTRVRWRLTPALSVEMETALMTKAVLRQSFEIACAHRLHVDALSDAENKRLFGKCNNPNGHGHNYRFEPAVEIEVDTNPTWGPADLEAVTNESLVARFDHKHLNLDTPEFGQGGLNPSVENIARVFFDILAPMVRDRSGARAALRSITVWETEKTSCTYPASATR